MPPALETLNLSKSFGNAPPSVNNLSLTVPQRAIYGFLGANGAGKTTTLKLVLRLMRPDAGSIRLFGGAPSAMAGKIGTLIEMPSLYDHLTGHENLDLTRRLLGLPPIEIERVLDIVGLTSAARQRVGGYSLGMRQRLAIARAMLGTPRMLILDEPSNGLDPDGIRDMRKLLRELPEALDVTLIISSHLLGEVEQFATHIGMIHQGRLLLEAPLENLTLNGAVEVGVSDRAAAACLLLDAGMYVENAPGPAAPLLVRGAEPADIARLLVHAGHDIDLLTRRRNALEHIYHEQIARAA